MKKLRNIFFATALLSCGTMAMDQPIEQHQGPRLQHQGPRSLNCVVSNGVRVVQSAAPVVSQFLDQGIRELSIVVGATGVLDSWASHVVDKRISQRLSHFEDLWRTMTDAQKETWTQRIGNDGCFKKYAVLYVTKYARKTSRWDKFIRTCLRFSHASLAFAYTMFTPNYASGEDNEVAKTVRTAVTSVLCVSNVLDILTHHYCLADKAYETAFNIVHLGQQGQPVRSSQVIPQN